MKLSFCITCKNRFYQIKNTLKKNLVDNIDLQHEIEFILVDFGSTDGLKEWIQCNFAAETASGYLKYYYTDALPAWHSSVAKNTAHSLATGQILVNLDCDNYTGKNGGRYVINQFEKYGTAIVLHQASGIAQDGSFGRIALLKKYFDMLGGYDERFYPMGYQDNDIINRAVEIGLLYICTANKIYNKAIKNNKEDGIRHTGTTKTYQEMLQGNIRISNINLFTGNIIANIGQPGN